MSPPSRPAPGKRDYFSGGPIAALATGPGGAIDILRASGDGVAAALAALTRSAVTDFPARELKRTRIYASSGAVLDEALVVRFVGSASYTGEDSFEIHLHGGGYIARRILEELALLGVPQALPGEFTFRSVKNGKLSLPAALAVSDLIAASNDGAVGLAVDKLAGLQIRALADTSVQLKNLAALAELGIDFSDQGLEETSLATLREKLRPIRETLRQLEGSFSRGVRLQSGVESAFLGLPNAGKSSFFNALLGEDRSIVSATAGTTRDVVRERLTLRAQDRSVTLHLSDTAGLRQTPDEIEAEGVARAHRALKSAELVFWVVDATADAQKSRDLCRELPLTGKTTLGVLNKIDLIPEAQRPALIEKCRQTFPIADWVGVSSLSGHGVTEAVDWILARTSNLVARTPGEAVLTRLDQLQCVRTAGQHLDRALTPDPDYGHELLAADLRQTLDALGPVIGETPPDEILGKIFSEFCIGK